MQNLVLRSSRPLDQTPYFTLSDSSFKKLEQDSVPNDVTRKLTPLKGKVFTSEKLFLGELEKRAGDAAMKDYRAKLLNCVGRDTVENRISHVVLKEFVRTPLSEFNDFKLINKPSKLPALIPPDTPDKNAQLNPLGGAMPDIPQHPVGMDNKPAGDKPAVADPEKAKVIRTEFVIWFFWREPLSESAIGSAGAGPAGAGGQPNQGGQQGQIVGAPPPLNIKVEPLK